MRRETRDKILMIILGIAFFLNITAINLFPAISEELVVVGYTIFGTGAFLYILSAFTLRGKGISNIVDSGIYGVVRHQLYLGVMTMFFSHIFLGQNWIVVISTIVALVCCYLIILSDEEKSLEKFGYDYKRYMEKTPRINFVLGIIRLLQRRREKKTNFQFHFNY